MGHKVAKDLGKNCQSKSNGKSDDGEQGKSDTGRGEEDFAWEGGLLPFFYPVSTYFPSDLLHPSHSFF